MELSRPLPAKINSKTVLDFLSEVGERAQLVEGAMTLREIGDAVGLSVPGVRLVLVTALLKCYRHCQEEGIRFEDYIDPR